MVRNTKGGNKSKKIKSAGFKTTGRQLKIREKDNDSSQLYGKILKKLGGNPPYLDVLCEDGIERTCVVRGKFVKRIWMNQGDFVIIIYNKELSDSKGEIYHKYENHEISKLVDLGELNLKIYKVNSNDYNENESDDNLIFTENTSEDDNEIEDKLNKLSVDELLKLDNNINNLSNDDDSDIDISEI